MTVSYTATTKETPMSKANTYELPFGDTIRIFSTRRFVLVRQFDGADSKPFIVARSDSKATLEAKYNRDTDYIIDQLRGYVHYHFNGKAEVANGRGVAWKA